MLNLMLCFVGALARLQHSRGRMLLRGLRLNMVRDAQFAGSSSVPAHVEKMGFLGIGNNPMVGATVAVATALSKQSH